MSNGLLIFYAGSHVAAQRFGHAGWPAVVVRVKTVLLRTRPADLPAGWVDGLLSFLYFAFANEREQP